MKNFLKENKVFYSFVLVCVLVCSLISVCPVRVNADMVSYSSEYPTYSSDSGTLNFFKGTYVKGKYTYSYSGYIKNISGDSPVYFLWNKFPYEDYFIYRLIAFSSSYFTFTLKQPYSSEVAHNGVLYDSLYYVAIPSVVSDDPDNWTTWELLDGIPIHETSDSYDYKSDDFAFLKSILNSTYSKDDLEGLDWVTYDPNLAVYESTLGSLQNVSLTVSSVTLSSQHSMPVSRISFSPITSEGIDLRGDGCDVEYYITMQSYVDGSLYKSCTSDFMLVSDNDCGTSTSCVSSVSSGVLYITGSCDAYQNLYKEVTSDLSVFSTASVKLQYWLRPVRHNGVFGCFGDWTKISLDGTTNALTGKYSVSVVTGTTDDGKADSTGNISNVTSSSSQTGTVGSGDTYESASASSTPSHEVDSSSSDLWANAETMLNGIGNVPAIIASVFSFLPAWCLGFVAVAFGLIVLLIIYKLVRG